jgi:hypothetical protein
MSAQGAMFTAGEDGDSEQDLSQRHKLPAAKFANENSRIYQERSESI